ncbi:glycosyltransferase [Candidatus Fermentibacteria bacterium]|nr:glycosyltransferase [Candidatus Fermentibacteria bacterium]
MRVMVSANCRLDGDSADNALALATILSRRGHDVLLQGREGNAPVTRAKQLGMDVAAVGLSGGRLLTGLAGYARVLRGWRPDVMVAFQAEGQTAAALAGRRLPLVRVLHELPRSFRGAFRRMVDRRTDLVVFPSEFMARKGCAGERAGYASVIPHPVETERFRPSEAAGKEPILLSVGRLVPEKGHRVLIRALSMLPDEVRAVIAGPEARYSRRDLLDYSRELGVAERLDLPGPIEDPRSLYSAARLGVVCSLGREVVSRAAMEMMASGLPVLAAATDSLVDLVSDGRTGLFHSPGNHSQLARQVSFLLENPSVVKEMGAAARDRACRMLSFDVVGETWEKQLRALCGGEQHPDWRVPRSGPQYAGNSWKE